jgi:hypothetical protein
MLVRAGVLYRRRVYHQHTLLNLRFFDLNTSRVSKIWKDLSTDSSSPPQSVATRVTLSRDRRFSLVKCSYESDIVEGYTILLRKVLL